MFPMHSGKNYAIFLFWLIYIKPAISKIRRRKPPLQVPTSSSCPRYTVCPSLSMKGAAWFPGFTSFLPSFHYNQRASLPPHHDTKGRMGDNLSTWTLCPFLVTLLRYRYSCNTSIIWCGWCLHVDVGGGRCVYVCVYWPANLFYLFGNAIHYSGPGAQP